MYPPELVAPMKNDLTSVGFKELLSASDVDAVMKETGITSATYYKIMKILDRTPA